MTNLFRKPLVCAALVAWGTFLITLGVARRSPPLPLFGDSSEYMQLAAHVAAGDGFTMDGHTPAVYRPPLFAAFLGYWFRITANESASNASTFQAVALGIGALASVLLLTLVLKSSAWALLGGILLMLNPFLTFNAIFVLQEPLLLTVTVVAVLLSLRALERKTPSSAFFAGVAWGVCTLGKVSTWFAPLLLAFFLRRLNAGRRIGLLLLGFCLVVLPWTYRNYRHFDRFILVNDQGLGALQWFVGKGAMADAGGEALVTSLKTGALPAAEQRRALWAFILHHPTLTVKQELKNAFWFCMIYRIWFEKYTAWPMSAKYWLWPALLIHGPLYLGFFLGAWSAWRRRDAMILFLTLFYALYWGQHILYWGEPRLAMPVWPILLALGLDGWRESRALDLDSPETVLVHQRIIEQKGLLRRLYTAFYGEFQRQAEIVRDLPGVMLELGSGGGFLKRLMPEVVTSDVAAYPTVDRVAFADRLPFADGALKAIFLNNVLHHIPEPERFFKEAERCLTPGGRIVMIEPYNSRFGRMMYKRFHHEPFDETVREWRVVGPGRLTGSNQALPWVIFWRDRALFETRHPLLEILETRPHTALGYALSGGLSWRTPLPGALFPAVRWLDAQLSRFPAMFPLFQTIVLRRR